MSRMKRRVEYALKHSTFIQVAYRWIMSIMFRCVGLFVRTDNDLVLFVSFGGRAYNDSPRKIYEHLLCDPRYENLKYVWAFQRPEQFDIPRGEKVRIDTLRYFLIALRAKYWVTSVNIERGLRFKKRNTIYLNTWHGTPIKKVGNAVTKRKDFDFSNVNILCYGSQYEKEIFLRDFGAREGTLLYSGMPRNDELYDVSEQQIKKYRKKFMIPDGKKVILYAPTWRDSRDGGLTYSLEPPINIRIWQEQLQDEYVILFRTHVFTNKLIRLRHSDFLRDVSSYPEINDLLFIADVLISDYSATIFDYAVLSRPIVCFGYDYDEYKRERGVYFDLDEEIPGGVLRTEEAVIHRIKTMNYEAECLRTAEFRDRYVEAGGCATEMCIDALFRKGIR